MMADERSSFWDPKRRSAYLAETGEKASASQRIKDGVETAERLETLWAGLTDEEKAIIGALLTLERKSFVAPHDTPPLRGLIAKGLLAYPRGQGGVWMRAARTSYTVPPAVWAGLVGLRGDLDGAAAAAHSEAEAMLARITGGSDSAR
jgi:hypothetical protein